MQIAANRGRERWRIEDMDFDQIETESVRHDEFLFLTLASASFVEILSETYSDNLVKHFSGDVALTGWLTDHWQHEEVQHGRALRAYVKAVWPEFDWDASHEKFERAYRSFCTVEALEPSRALELVARCVVETGTSTFYRAMHDYVDEPVLRKLLENIKADEAAHYAYFRRYFLTQNEKERKGFAAIVGTIWRRLSEVRGEDTYLAFKFVQSARHPEKQFDEADWLRYNRTVKRLARRHYPFRMAAKMLIQPLPTSAGIKRLLYWPLVGMAFLASVG